MSPDKQEKCYLFAASEDPVALHKIHLFHPFHLASNRERGSVWATIASKKLFSSVMAIVS